MSAQRHSTIAITGTTGFIGSMLLQALVRRQRRPRLLAIDRFPPTVTPAHYTFVECDFTAPTADQQLAAVFRTHRVDTVIHAALHSQPKRNAEYSHELQSIGTMYLLHAANAAHVRKLVVSSTTDVYGAFPDNPLFLSEDHPLRGAELSSFLRDRIDVEKQFARYAKARPKTVVTVLRPCTVLGPKVRNYKTHLLKQSMIATILGYDPMVQFVHEQDVLRAFLTVIDHDAPGAFNIVGDGVLPLSHALAMIGKPCLPVARPLLWHATTFLWYLNVHHTPPSHIHFWQYPCVADGAKAKQQLGFHPVYSLREVLLSFRESQMHETKKR